ncbi:hypothetical protein [Sinomicrobium weinanense]|uniref:Uncharacterized protein n=1 Tax=Sinomicrobium weinanense TaxID=2842200 RepID=A0A926JNK0_9FLAO|nr:hypothetical protein [Sinomicrobium weinanense]MBC9794406.1 hypothetical protein [Sinomicrobium weinanense]MBU3124313.1 hypothetical protein [Sinomicrobium weinanense]
MDKDELLKLFRDNEGHFVPGIYNYCDRWCERCSFRSKCRVFSMEEGRTDEEKDAGNEKFWKKVGENLKLAMEMLAHMAEKKGIDLQEMEEYAPEEEAKLEKRASKHYLSVISKKYAGKNEHWLRKNEKLLHKTGEEFRENTLMGLSEDKARESVMEVRDAVEVIHWYSFQIHVKIMRALQHGKLNPEWEDPVQNDVNGSAKVALIGTRRSMAAWSVLLSRFGTHEDEILEILVLLENIKKGILEEFPDVEKFHRPGFDD